MSPFHRWGSALPKDTVELSIHPLVSNVHGGKEGCIRQAQKWEGTWTQLPQGCFCHRHGRPAAL